MCSAMKSVLFVLLGLIAVCAAQPSDPWGGTKSQRDSVVEFLKGVFDGLQNPSTLPPTFLFTTFAADVIASFVGHTVRGHAGMVLQGIHNSAVLHDYDIRESSVQVEGNTASAAILGHETLNGVNQTFNDVFVLSRNLFGNWQIEAFVQLVLRNPDDEVVQPGFPAVNGFP